MIDNYTLNGVLRRLGYTIRRTTCNRSNIYSGYVLLLENATTLEIWEWLKGGEE